ncbi:anti-sigma factor domain-containing protein [Agromyces aurantiacus]|uniref:Regulator of SigK n=1 Tax=Agromyces aurantiacus TaxID=165814 RepID=A0ABV9R1Z4_9MICO|nr:anti-sigma factor [Agromyces aurantiacus]MBM7505564.1 anti-sigma-K factor RskA [Agromyces aurantiacus]
MTGPDLPGRPGPVDPDDLLAAYALDAVTDEERALVERRLAESADARAEVEAYRAAAGLLADAAPPVAPPPSLKAAVFARLDDAPQAGAAGMAEAAEPEAPAQPAEAGGPAVPTAPAEDPFDALGLAGGEPADRIGPAAPVVPGDAARPGERVGPVEHAARRRWFQRPLAIAASVAAVAVLVTGAVVGLNWVGPAGWGAQREVQAIASAPDAQTATSPAEGGGEITLVWSEELGRSAVRAQDLPDVGDDQTYELWYIDADGAMPAGTFDPSRGAAYVVLDGEFEPGLLVGVTVEPAGGSEEPTTVPIVAFET